MDSKKHRSSEKNQDTEPVLTPDKVMITFDYPAQTVWLDERIKGQRITTNLGQFHILDLLWRRRAQGKRDATYLLADLDADLERRGVSLSERTNPNKKADELNLQTHTSSHGASDDPTDRRHTALQRALRYFKHEKTLSVRLSDLSLNGEVLTLDDEKPPKDRFERPALVEEESRVGAKRYGLAGHVSVRTLGAPYIDRTSVSTEAACVVGARHLDEGRTSDAQAWLEFALEKASEKKDLVLKGVILADLALLGVRTNEILATQSINKLEGLLTQWGREPGSDSVERREMRLMSVLRSLDLAMALGEVKGVLSALAAVYERHQELHASGTGTQASLRSEVYFHLGEAQACLLLVNPAHLREPTDRQARFVLWKESVKEGLFPDGIEPIQVTDPERMPFELVGQARGALGQALATAVRLGHRTLTRTVYNHLARCALREADWSLELASQFGTSEVHELLEEVTTCIASGFALRSLGYGGGFDTLDVTEAKLAVLRCRYATMLGLNQEQQSFEKERFRDACERARARAQDFSLLGLESIALGTERDGCQAFEPSRVPALEEQLESVRAQWRGSLKTG